MIPRKDGELSPPGLESHTEELFPFFSQDTPCGEPALGENCIEIISDKPNSLGMFLGIQSDINE